MSKYRVHVYAMVRVSFDVEANSFEEAATKVMGDEETLGNRLHQVPDYAEDYHDTIVVDQLDEKGEYVTCKDIYLGDLDQNEPQTVTPAAEDMKHWLSVIVTDASDLSDGPRVAIYDSREDAEIDVLEWLKEFFYDEELRNVEEGMERYRNETGRCCKIEGI